MRDECRISPARRSSSHGYHRGRDRCSRLTFIYGHDHAFVDQAVDGIHYALPGSCGVPWKFDRDVTGYERFWYDSGHGRLTVRPDRATVSFVNQTGQVIHELSVDPV